MADKPIKPRLPISPPVVLFTIQFIRWVKSTINGKGVLTGKYKKGINLPPQYMEMDPLETGGTFTNVGGKSY